MSFTWEVWAWVEGEEGCYEYEVGYQGKSFLRAAWVALQMKRSGVECIKVEWR
jgi:hypothetical protein